MVRRNIKLKIIAGMLAAAIIAVVTAGCGSASNGKKTNNETAESTGTSFGNRKLLGICTRNVTSRLKARVPSSEWPGFRNIRVNIAWASIEKSRNSFNWSYPDKVINNCLSLGVDSILVVIGTPVPVWAADPATPVVGERGIEYGPPKNPADFKNFCRAFAKRYQGYVDYFQIFQEPGWDLDAPPAKEGVVYYNGYCDQSYLGILRAGYNGIKAGNPEAYVISGGMLNGITRAAGDFANYKILLAGGNQDLSIKVKASRSIVAELIENNDLHDRSSGNTQETGTKSPRKTWNFTGVTTRDGKRERLLLENPNSSEVTANIAFTFSDGTSQRKSVELKGKSRKTISVNKLISMAGVTDGIDVHAYDYPEHWVWYCDQVKDICAENGYPDREIVICEIGWPHSGRSEYSEEGQREAIGKKGVGSLYGAGYRKIWIFEDIDDPPGTSWEDAYFGLFYYDGIATPAWDEYLRWQKKLVNYRNKPACLKFLKTE
ncbi:MAG: hypothetical protein JXA49_06840 [Actinobacteria bacterium]|nr:hypothetical protein [Actinomycetota bacterium]